jgi:hypothetical protein
MSFCRSCKTAPSANTRPVATMLASAAAFLNLAAGTEPPIIHSVTGFDTADSRHWLMPHLNPSTKFSSGLAPATGPRPS